MNPFKALAAFVADISPKVRGGLIWGLLAAAVTAYLNAVQPGDLSWAGPFEPAVFSATPILVGQIAAWSKADPLRAEGQKSLALKAAAANPAVEVPSAPVADPTVPPAPAPQN